MITDVLYFCLLFINSMETKEQNLWEEKSYIEPEKNCLNNIEIDKKDTTTAIENKSVNVLPNTTAVSGIYIILNKVNNKWYVGQSINIKNKWYKHKWQLKRNIHKNPHLQSAWNKYNENNFEFYVIELVEISDLFVAEQKYLDWAKQHQYECYNKNFISGNPPVITEEIRKKISIANRGRVAPNRGIPCSTKQREQISKSLTGRKLSIETIEKLRKSMRGRPSKLKGRKIHSIESKMKISKSNTGKNNYMFGKHHTEESKQKMRNLKLHSCL